MLAIKIYQHATCQKSRSNHWVVPGLYEKGEKVRESDFQKVHVLDMLNVVRSRLHAHKMCGCIVSNEVTIMRPP